MATAAVYEDTRDTECAICSDPFKDPKLLLCGHLLCRHCLRDWVTSKEDAKCPICRCTIMDTQSRGSQSVDQFLDGLPSDLGLRNKSDAVRTLDRDHTCCVCEDVAATTICLTCQDKFCTACSKCHQKMSATKHHCMQSLATPTPDTLSLATPSVCVAHSDRPSDVFCSTHSVAICTVCATTDHRQCTLVRQERKFEEDHAELRKLEAILSQRESEVDKAIQELDNAVKKADDVTQARLEKAIEFYDQIIELAKKQQQQMTELATQASSRNAENIKERRSSLVTLKTRLRAHKESTTRAVQLKACADISQMTVAMKARLSQLDCSAVLSSEDLCLTSLVLNQKAAARVKTSLLELGQLRTETHLMGRTEAHLMGRTEAHLMCQTQSAPFSFHSNHGKNVLLRNDGHLAEKPGKIWNNGIVISSQPMTTNFLYEVEVKSLAEEGGRTMLISPGVVTVSPDHLTLPHSAYMWTSAIVVDDGDTFIRGQRVSSSFGKQLKGLRIGSRVGVSVDGTKKLRVYRDGVCLGVVTDYAPQPAYALFELWRPFNHSVAALPPTRLK